MPLVDGALVLVVGPGGEGLAAADPANRLAVLLRRFDGVDEDVVRVIVVGSAEPPAHDAVFGGLAVQDDLDYVIELHVFLDQGVPEGLRLDEIAGEAVEEPSLGAIRLFQAIEDHGDGDLIGNELAAVDIILRFFTEFRAFFDVVSEDDASLDMGYAEFLLDNRPLGAFAAAVGSKNENIHAAELLSGFFMESRPLIMDSTGIRNKKTMTDRHGSSVASGGGAGSGGAGSAPRLAAGKGGHQFPGLFGFAGRAGNRLLPVGSEEDLLEFLPALPAFEFIDGHRDAP